jgi:purine-binding chemotaxis protein CheW
MAVTLPAGLPLGQQVSLAAGKRLLLIDTTGEASEGHLLDFLRRHVEPAFRDEAVENTATPSRVDDPSEELQILEFSVGVGCYGIDARHVREVIASQALTEVPGTAPSVVGVISRGGRVLPVIDLNRWFKIEAAASGAARRIIVLISRCGDLGFLVDAVADIRKLSAAGLEPPSAALSSSVSDFLIGFAHAEHGLITILDAEGLAARATTG